MKTSSFWHYPKGGNRIAISRSVPRKLAPGYRLFKALAPGPWFKDYNQEADYRARYEAEILAALDPQQTWERLHQLAGGNEPILLCWEPLIKPDEWCHRRMVADWFERELGVTVEEYQPAPLMQPDLFNNDD